MTHFLRLTKLMKIHRFRILNSSFPVINFLLNLNFFCIIKIFKFFLLLIFYYSLAEIAAYGFVALIGLFFLIILILGLTCIWCTCSRLCRLQCPNGPTLVVTCVSAADKDLVLSAISSAKLNRISCKIRRPRPTQKVGL